MVDTRKYHLPLSLCSMTKNKVYKNVILKQEQAFKYRQRGK